MSSQKLPSFRIKACYLGPVFELEDELTKQAQILVFARNGTGKSFLSRAFRCFDLHQQGKDLSKAAFHLVSEESPDTASLSFLRGTTPLGELALSKNTDAATVTTYGTIFHVFSEDFVSDELRVRGYEIDGDIENEITVDSDNIEINEVSKDLEAAQTAFDVHRAKLAEAFETAKLAELATKAKVSKQLGDYKALTLDEVLQANEEKPTAAPNSLSAIIDQLDKLKAIPAEPDYPQAATGLDLQRVEVTGISQLLGEAVSPSTVADVFKQKVEAHHSFYEAGVARVTEHDLDSCPFCEQSITAGEPKTLIDNFVEYFNDAEEKHRRALKEQAINIQDARKTIDRIETVLARQRGKFDMLKGFVPSQSTKSLEVPDEELQSIRDDLGAIEVSLNAKLKATALPLSLGEQHLEVNLGQLNELIARNNDVCADLQGAVAKADNERRKLQRDACSVFGLEFVIEHWTSIETLRGLDQKLTELQQQLAELEKSGPSKQAKDRVADTFVLLLKEFFGDKYVFDKATFALKRGDSEMTRGPHRTLSDGEKTAIAFCYFIAAIHKRVTANSDYEKLFLVFDDPVTSMSYDYIFAIAQTLKHLNISKLGEISVNPSKVDGNISPRPNLLVLTHSSYFFNVARANAVIRPEATFALSNNGTKHTITRMSQYVAPFEQQLEHIYRVAEGTEPDHSTGNCIRSVIEAVGRFCRPDKTPSVQEFITFLAGEEGISVKSTLINSMCHGTYYDETPTAEDITLACNEAIAVVERYALGHLEILKKADKAKAN